MRIGSSPHRIELFLYLRIQQGNSFQMQKRIKNDQYEMREKTNEKKEIKREKCFTNNK